VVVVSADPLAVLFTLFGARLACLIVEPMVVVASVVIAAATGFIIVLIRAAGVCEET
jgi:glutamate-1-semialdehyde aminotransferase